MYWRENKINMEINNEIKKKYEDGDIYYAVQPTEESKIINKSYL